MVKLYFLSFFIFPFNILAESFVVPSMTSPIVDQASILTTSQQRELEDILYNFKRSQNAQIQVLITSDLMGESIESAAIKVFDKWKLGDEKKDDGLLLLISIKDKRMRIEVGQGLEGIIPDVIAKRIIAEVIRPFFQRGEYYNGIRLGLLAIQGTISKEYGTETNLTNQVQKSKKQKSFSLGVMGLLFGIWLIIFIFSPSTGLYILSAILTSRGGNYGGSRGGWSGGGGRSSGGGASGGW